MPLTTSDRSFLVTVSAQAISSVGFGLSLLAIWVRWLVPLASPDQPPTPILPKHRRRSPTRTCPIPSSLPPHHIPSSPPPHPIMNHDGSTHHTNPSHKHVTFVDRPKTELKLEPADQGHQVYPAEPKSPPPTEESPPPPDALDSNQVPKKDLADELFDSDSSRRSLPKIKNPFAGKRRRSSLPPLEEKVHDPQDPYAHASKPPKNGNAGRFAPRTPTRHASPTVAIFYDPPTSKVPSPRRCSSAPKIRHKSAPVPIRRTSPYEAPYFATPPIPIDLKHVDPWNAHHVGRDSNTTVRNQPIAKEKTELGIDTVQLSSEAQALPTSRRPLFRKRRSVSLDAACA